MASKKALAVQLLLLVVLISTASSFSPTCSPSHRRAAMPHKFQKHFTHIKSDFPLQSSPNNGDQGYNDDAFGLIFLSGGILAKDVDFSGTFLVLSALAATCTTVGTIKFDERIPAAVAFMTLLISPIESSLRLSGSLGSIAPPSLVEIGLCTVSAAWAFVKWSKQE
jgi:hypothetical protein|mmetsp:Transcript_16312/g.24184  ORF Transcript_16312/g.24184 Transcript_16312/m.24184 type:complete len:166 (-) Transcript_16312:1603-2100(-)